jgi:hypothetical protein
VLFDLVEENLSTVFLGAAAFFVLCAVYCIIFVQEPLPPVAPPSPTSAKEGQVET